MSFIILHTTWRFLIPEMIMKDHRRNCYLAENLTLLHQRPTQRSWRYQLVSYITDCTFYMCVLQSTGPSTALQYCDYLYNMVATVSSTIYCFWSIQHMRHTHIRLGRFIPLTELQIPRYISNSSQTEDECYLTTVVSVTNVGELICVLLPNIGENYRC